MSQRYNAWARDKGAAMRRRVPVFFSTMDSAIYRDELTGAVTREIAMHGLSTRSFEQIVPNDFVLRHDVRCSGGPSSLTTISAPTVHEGYYQVGYERFGTSLATIAITPEFTDAVQGIILGLQYFNPRPLNQISYEAPISFARHRHSTK